MSGFKGKTKGRSGSSSSALRSNQKRAGFFSGRSNSASASDEVSSSSYASTTHARSSIGSLLPEKTDTELTYADIIQALNASISEVVSGASISDTLPPTKALLSLQYDLDKLLKLNAKNIDECDRNLGRIKRLSAAIERENTKRAKIVQSSVEASDKLSVTPPVDQLPMLDDSDIKIKKESDANYAAFATNNIGLEDEDHTKKTTPEYEKNPKSEFVESQELPIAILGLFDEKEAQEGLPTNGEEFLKKKYGVASYPTDNLKEQLPGEIPDMDFTKAKPPNQVQFSTFSSYIEPYFRQYTEEDLAFLQQKFITLAAGPGPGATASASSAAIVDPNSVKKALLSPYIIPPLGPLYANTWAVEDGPNPGYNLSPPPVPSKEEVEAKGTSESIQDDVLEAETISCGPLASRLLAALMSESVLEEDIKKEDGGEDDQKVKIEDKDGDSDSLTMKLEPGVEDDDKEPVGDTAVSALIDGNWKISSLKTDYSSLEDRLKREFKYVGILDINLLQKEEKIRQKFEMKFANGGAVNGAAAGGAGGANPASVASATGASGAGSAVSTGATGAPGEEFGIDWIKGREDDEICHEMRILQRELRRVSYLNRAYKHRLYPIIQEQMAWQEYSHILEDLDKQVDQAYLRRTRANTRTKKKKSLAAHPPASAAAAAGTPGAGAAGAGTGATGGAAGAAAVAANSLEQQPQRLKALLDKRMKWITKIGPVFRSPQEMKRLPKTSVFESIRYPPVRSGTASGAAGETGDASAGTANGTANGSKRLAGGVDDFEDDELGDWFDEFGGEADENEDLLYGMRSTGTPGK